MRSWFVPPRPWPGQLPACDHSTDPYDPGSTQLQGTATVARSHWNCIPINGGPMYVNLLYLKDTKLSTFKSGLLDTLQFQHTLSVKGNC